MKKLAFLFACVAFQGGCMTAQTPAQSYPAIGRIEATSPHFTALLNANTAIEKLAEGYQWSEGPVWIPNGDYLLFSDVPANKMFRWSEADGVSVFLDPSGYDGPEPDDFREPGTNGLIRGPGNTILAADHGSRALVRIDLATKQKTPIVERFEGKRFNSPNDLVLAKNGAIYFTDPPYGLEGLNDSPLKELPFNGVFRLDPNGTMTLVHKGLSFPNGVILSPDEKTLYVANSDPQRAVIVAFDVQADGSLARERIFADLTAQAKAGAKGLPDGMAMDRAGNLFATGPGGVLVFAPDGTQLGLIETGTAVANVTFGEDGKTLFLTSHNMLARLRTRTTGLGF